MKLIKGRGLVVGGGIISLLVVAWLVLWGWVLMAADSYNHPLFKLFPWPMACSQRGCLTARDWRQSYQASAMFAESLKENPPGTNEALTTAIRHHMIKQAFLGMPITTADAKRYRQEILRLEDENTVRERSGLSISEYDEVVLVPLLRQEALRQQHKIANFEDLFKMLARDQKVVVLPRGLIWNQEEARVERK